MFVCANTANPELAEAYHGKIYTLGRYRMAA